MACAHLHIEEESLFSSPAVVVERARVVESLRRLHQGDPLIHEPAERDRRVLIGGRNELELLLLVEHQPGPA